MMVPSEAEVLQAGGWPASYAKVLAVAVDGDVGVAVVDVNGDSNIISVGEMSYSGQWGVIAETSGPGVGRSQRAVIATGWAEPGTTIGIKFESEMHTTVANSSGWWAFARRVDTAVGVLPTVVPA